MAVSSDDSLSDVVARVRDEEDDMLAREGDHRARCSVENIRLVNESGK